jgi:hypothetical protein
MKAGRRTGRSCLVTLVALGAMLAWSAQPAAANHIAFVKGDLAVSIGDGKINHYSSTGTLKETLNTNTGTLSPPGNETGMCFDPAGRLYTTNFDDASMSRFNNLGGLINAQFGPLQDFPPNSCVVDQAGQYVYAGLNEGDNELLKLDTNGTLVDTLFLEVDAFGIGYIDLSKDGCSLYYTSEGTYVLRYDICTKTQLADFANSLPGPCYAVRIRTNGEALVACDSEIVRLNSSGQIIQHYTPGNEADFYALALDPDNASFWVAGYSSGHVYKVNIASGSTSTNFVAPLTVVDTGVGGIAVYGDGTADPGFPRPKGATPMRASLVPAFKPCTAPNRTHGSPLVRNSCAPPVQQSSFLTVGSPDANGAAANSQASVLFSVVAGNTATPADEADVQIKTSITDVRNKTGLGDYTGQLQLSTSLRSTDRYNSQEQQTQPFNDTATGQDTTFNVTIPCASTTATNIGSNCVLNTTADAVVPAMIKESVRQNLQMGTVQVFDGGSDGLVSTSGNTLFMDQGWFTP